jgi:hypothetical protein
MNSEKLPSVYVTYDTRRKVWVLMFDYKLSLPVDKRERIDVSIPAGFEFDLASIPRPIWPLIGSFELSLVAPLIHDYFYQYTGRPVYHRRILDNLPVPAGSWHDVSRAEADRLFLSLMLREGVTSWKSHAAYRAVRLFAHRW